METRHGQWKVPGGKYLTVDLDVADERVVAARLAGDFFLEPAEALGVLDAALTGLPVTSKPHVLAGIVETALRQWTTRTGRPISLIGFDADDVAQVIGLTLGTAKSPVEAVERAEIPPASAGELGGLSLEILRPGPLPIAQNVALDEVLAAELAAGRRGATFRWWDWGQARAVVIGSFQSYANELWPEGVVEHDVQVVRRISGGGAMFMEGPNCVTFSLVVPAAAVAGMSFEASYAALNQWLLGGLRELGIAAEVSGLNDVSSPAGKIAGSAQKRYGSPDSGVVVHHVTMAYDIDAAKMAEVLRLGKAQVQPKGHPSAVTRVDPLRSQTEMTREAVIEALDGFLRTQFECRDSELTAAESAAAEELAVNKFAAAEWLHRVP